MNTMNKIITIISIVFFLPFFSFAVSISWTGAVDNDWHEAGNWSPAQVPSILDEVQIIGTPSANAIDIIANATCKKLLIDNMIVSIANDAIVEVGDGSSSYETCVFQNNTNVAIWTQQSTIQVYGLLHRFYV